jgi:hypothetical protein
MNDWADRLGERFRQGQYITMDQELPRFILGGDSSSQNRSDANILCYAVAAAPAILVPKLESAIIRVLEVSSNYQLTQSRDSCQGDLERQ